MPYQQITSAERYQLSQLLWWRLSIAAIARILGRHRSTVYRELARNRSARDRYEWYHADRRALGRRSHSRRNRRLGPAYWAIVEPYLAAGWSPEQIAGRWQVQGQRWISHEAIYQYLYRDRTGGGRLYQWLPLGRKTRRRRFGRKRLGGPRGRSITERPARAGGGAPGPGRQASGCPPSTEQHAAPLRAHPPQKQLMPRLETWMTVSAT